jgi:preprotein translocase subunit SecF
MGKFSRLGNDLYNGKRSIDFIGRRHLWYAVSLVLVALAIVAVVGKGLNFGVEFTGGTQFRVAVPEGEATQDNVDRLRDALGEADITGAETPTVTTAGGSLSIRTEDLTPENLDAVSEVIQETVEVTDPEQDISADEIGASWGREVAERAITGVILFLILTMLFIWAYFREWKMSIAAIVALFHDIAITVGVYALSGFQVTPSAVTGLLAILGFSLYDTVVVFDKVRENTNELRRSDQTYDQATNLAVNQTLVRSINTGIVALIPIGAILFISAGMLGASSLQDLALSQFVGMAVGVYSSVCLAPRILVHLKSNESEVVLQARRAKARARAKADKYASVPAFTEDLPVPEQTDEADEVLADDAPVSAPAPARGVDPGPTGRGRTVPENRRPVRESRSSGRQQPSRQPKSKRQK